MQRLSNERNDAYNQLYLAGRSESIDELMKQRNQPINEMAALLSGSQITNPSFINTPTSGVAPTDVLGATGQSLAQQNVGFNAANQNYQGMMSGLFGLGKTALGGWGMGGFKVPSFNNFGNVGSA